MHTWDLARATGQDDTLDPEYCAVLLEGMIPVRGGDARVHGRSLRIVDNGRGFDVDNVTPGHLGLAIRERADAIGAQLELSAGRPRHRTHRAGMITVLVVDDHDLLREGVSSCLSAFDDLEVVGESASGEDGLEAATRLCPDVVVIDLIMPGMGGVEAITADACRQRVDRSARPQHVRPR